MNKKVKIAFIISNLGQGGAERQFFELIRNIDKLKFDVSVLLYAYNDSFFYSEIDNVDNIKVFKNELRSKWKIFKILEALWVIHRFLKKTRFDLIFTSLFMNSFLVRLVSPKRYNNRIVTTIRNSLIIYTKKHIFIEKYLLKKSFLVTNTKDVAERFSKLINDKYKFKVTTIYNGFDTKRFSFNGNKLSDRILIGNVGRMAYQKNQIQILRVFASLNNPNINLKIIGSAGDQTKILHDFLNNSSNNKNVDLLDKKVNIEDYYQDFDIFVLSSHYEGCPNVLFEAMLSGCLCIVSEKANTDFFVVDGYNGLVYDNSDGDLASKLTFALSIVRKEEGKRLVEAGYNYAIDNFSISSMVTQYEQLFIMIHEKNKGRN